MVKRLQNTFALLLLLWSVAAQATPSLRIEIKKPMVEYGRPVYLKIIAEGLKDDLSKLQTDALLTQFAIDTMDLETEIIYNSPEKSGRLNDQRKTASAKKQILRLKLYPRQTGELLIPAFRLNKSSSSQQTITVADASSKGAAILLNSKISSTEVWQREQIIISVSLTTGEEFATLKIRESAVNGLEITALPMERVWSEKDGGRSLITAGWSILPLRAGEYAVELPPFEYHLNGVVRRVFHLPRLKLNVRPLPSYLPPTIPVARLNIRSSITGTDSTTDGILLTDELAYWNVDIESPSLTPYWLPPVLRQIQSSDSIQFFPATSKRSIKPDSTGVHGKVSHTIPFKPLKNGYVDLPDLQLQYFDPETGRLETLQHVSDKPFAFGVFSRLLTGLFLLLFILIVLKTGYRYLLGKIHYRNLHKQAVMQIRQANSSRQLVDAIRLAGEAEGWPLNVSLTEWLQRWKKKYITGPELEQKLTSLALLHYGNSTDLKEPPADLADGTRLAQLIESPKRIH